MRQRARYFVAGATAIACCLFVSLWGSLGWWFPAGDYPGPPCNGCDSAGPPLAFLVRGHVHRFFSTQPFMGSVSLVLRAPAVAVVTLLKDDVSVQYRVGTLVCFLAAAALLLPGIVLIQRRGQPLLIALIVIAAIFLGPATFAALRWGHPEELLGAALAIAAVLAASHRRMVAAGVLLGLAVATEQWGLFAVLPVLMLARGQRRLVASVSLIVAGAFIVPMLAGSPTHFFEQNLNTANAQLGETPTNIWWPFHHIGFDPTSKQNLEMIPDALRVISHPLAVAVVIGLSVVYWRRSAGRHPYDALLLLALCFLVRCLFDPLTMSYHHVPFVMTIAMYEGLRCRRIPIVTLTSTAMILVVGDFIAPLGKPDLMFAVYLLWGLFTAAYLSISAFGRRDNLVTSTRLLEQPPLARPVVVAQ